MSLRAYVLNEDGVERGYKVGGLFGVKKKGGFVYIDGRQFVLNPKFFYKRAFRPFFPWLFLRVVYFWAIDYRWDSPNPIAKFDKSEKALPTDFEPRTIGVRTKSWALSELHTKGMDMFTIIFLISILMNLVLIVSLVMR